MTVVTRRMDDEGEVDEDEVDEGEVDEDSGSLMKVKLMKTVDHCGRIRPRPRTGRLDRVERGEGGCLCATLSTLPYTRGCYFIYSIFTATIRGAKLCYI